MPRAGVQNGGMPVLAPLHDLPSSAVFALFMAMSAALAALVCAAASPIVRTPNTKDMLDIAMRTTGAVTAALTLTLAFCAVQARSQMADAQRVVQAEATAIAGAGRLVDRIGPPAQALPPALAAYLASIIATEFPASASQGRQEATQSLVEQLETLAFHTAIGLPQAQAEELIEHIDALEAARETRLSAATTGLPAQFWMLIALLLSLTFASGAMYPARAHVLAMLAIQAAGLGALVAFVFLMEQPFRGEFAVSPEPYQTVQRSLTHKADLLRQVGLRAP